MHLEKCTKPHHCLKPRLAEGCDLDYILFADVIAGATAKAFAFSNAPGVVIPKYSVRRNAVPSE